jgi:hypothetical protein
MISCPLVAAQVRISTHLARVAIADDFTSIRCDIDGDGSPDLPHGEVVSRYIRAQNPDVEIVPFNSINWNPASLFESLKKIQQDGHFDAVNISIAKFMENLATPENFSTWRTDTLRDLQNTEDSGGELTYSLIEQIQQLIQQGIQVYIAGGNNGPQELNKFTLAEGSINVGASDAQGNREGYSANSPFINRWAQGTYAVRKVQGGFDISGHGEADVLDSEVTGGTSLLRQFIDKPLEQVLASPSQHASWPSKSVMESKVFSLPELVSGKILPPEFLEDAKAYGEYVVIHPKNRTIAGFLTTDAKGRMTVKPEKFGSPDGVVNQIRASSFAAPVVLGQDSLVGFKARKML